MTAGGLRLWVAVERLPDILALYPKAVTDARVRVPAEYAQVRWEREAARTEVLRPVWACSDPDRPRPWRATSVSPRTRSRPRSMPWKRKEPCCAAPSPGGEIECGGEIEWCDRRLLARIHRYTVDRLRREASWSRAPTSWRFLTAWQHVSADSRLSGVPAVLERLACFGAPAPAWEADLLPARLWDYDPGWLDRFCLSGQGVWRRRLPEGPGEGAAATLAPSHDDTPKLGDASSHWQRMHAPTRSATPATT